MVDVNTEKFKHVLKLLFHKQIMMRKKLPKNY